MIKNNQRVLGFALALALLLTGAVATFWSQSAEAIPVQEVVTTFYSDASLTNIVGERIRPCHGGTISWGITSSYKTIDSFPCH
jgi:hypothetical protein